MKSIISCFLAFLVGLCCCVSIRALPEDTPHHPPTVSAQSAILINADDRSVYFEKSADTRLGMASTTKLMTALVVAEHCDPEAIVTVSPEAVGIEGSSIYLVQGERLTVKQLLYALLLSSANDAAEALSLWVGGTTEAFCEMMNARAKELGLRQTHFTNPHGLYHEAHYTTARELAIIAAEVLAVPLLRQIVATARYTIPHDGVEDQRLLLNHNKLLRTYEGAIGMKTGFTKKTGRTLVSAAERDGLTLIAVTLNDPDDWRDHAEMLDYGFERYETITIAIGAFTFSMPITGGTRETVTLINAEPLTITVPKGHEEPYYKVEGTAHFLFADIEAHAPGGIVTLFCAEKQISAPLVTAYGVSSRAPNRQSPLDRLLNFFNNTESTSYKEHHGSY